MKDDGGIIMHVSFIYLKLYQNSHSLCYSTVFIIARLTFCGSVIRRYKIRFLTWHGVTVNLFKQF